ELPLVGRARRGPHRGRGRADRGSHAGELQAQHRHQGFWRPPARSRRHPRPPQFTHARRARVPAFRPFLLRRLPVSTLKGALPPSDPPQSMGAPPTSDSPSVLFRYEPMPDLDRPLRERLGQYPRVPDLTFDALRMVARWIAIG